MDDEDMEDGDAEMDLAMDMEPEADAEEGDAPDVEEAMDDVEEAIAELRAAFAEMQGEESLKNLKWNPEMEESVEETEAVEETDEVEAVEEGATMSAVSVIHSDTADKVHRDHSCINDAQGPNRGGDEKGRSVRLKTWVLMVPRSWFIAFQRQRTKMSKPKVPMKGVVI